MSFNPFLWVLQGMGIDHLLKTLCAYLKQDVEPFAGQAENRTNAAKRMQFWLMLANKLAVACPEACSTGWDALLKWHVYARHRLNRLVAAFLVQALQLLQTTNCGL